jgi:hypothetical protein
LEYHFLLARDLGLLRADDYRSLDREVGEVKRMLAAFIGSLRPRKAGQTSDTEKLMN